MAQLLSQTMELVHENSMFAIESLQNRFNHHEKLFFAISNFFDPRYAFLIYAPLLYSLDKTSGKKLMWVTVIAEWMNQILKWVLHGERPYWWVHETEFYNRTGVMSAPIKQYFMTCETGPGSPSGHSMVAAAIWYVLIEALLKKAGALNKNTRHLLASFCWSAYAVMNFVVSVSRVYIAAHFPHQCALGLVIGLGVAIHLSKIMSVLDRLNLRHYIVCTAAILATALGTFVFLRFLGMNPLWSVDRALKWCARIEYIHVDTTPFFSMMRYAGFLLGMGLGFNSALQKTIGKQELGLGRAALSATICILISKVSEKVGLPTFNMGLFYVLAFTLNALLPYLFVALVPYFVVRLLPRRSSRKVD